VRNPYIEALKRRAWTPIPCGPGVQRSPNANERELIASLLREFEKIDRKFSIPVVSKLRKIGDQCEAGGHKGRARMFRALAKEFEYQLGEQL
jgi:hypothetical protein